MHTAHVMIGSNINPVENTRQAVIRLSEETILEAFSTTWETKSVGFDGPNFLNTMVSLKTDLNLESLKKNILSPIEKNLGRVRTVNKNSPRTIDLDITIFDGEIVDTALWRRAHIALPAAELLPNLRHPETGQTLKEIAEILKTMAYAIPRDELNFRRNVYAQK